jgi:hypothetical protein
LGITLQFPHADGDRSGKEFISSEEETRVDCFGVAACRRASRSLRPGGYIRIFTDSQKEIIKVS